MDVHVRFHGALAQRADGPNRIEVALDDHATLPDLLDVVAERLPRVERSIRDETGTVRPHVHLFVDGEPARDPAALARPLHPGAQVLVLPAVSGG